MATAKKRYFYVYCYSYLHVPLFKALVFTYDYKFWSSVCYSLIFPKWRANKNQHQESCQKEKEKKYTTPKFVIFAKSLLGKKSTLA